MIEKVTVFGFSRNIDIVQHAKSYSIGAELAGKKSRFFVPRKYDTLGEAGTSASNLFSVRQSNIFNAYYRKKCHKAIKESDLIITSGVSIDCIYIMIISRLFFKKNWAIVHDVIPHPGLKAIITYIYNIIIWIFAHKVITMNKNNARMFGKKRIYSQLAGISMRDVIPVTTKENYYLAFGRAEYYKGFDLISKLSPHINGTIIAAGKNVGKYLSSTENIQVMDKRLEDDELDLLISKARCVILPYRSASQSGVVVDAFRCGTPVVAFDVGGLSDYIEEGQTGYMVEFGNYDSFAKKMVDSSLLSSSLIQKHYQEKFSFEAATFIAKKDIQDNSVN